MVAADLVLDWSHLKFYNTLMALAAGASLASIARVMRDIAVEHKVKPHGWAINFGALGLLAFATGMTMTLTWPLAPEYAYDNISFGEPEAILGAIMLAMAFYFWKRADAIVEADDPMKLVASDLVSMRILITGAGLGLIGISIAVMVYGLFTAPSEEPIVGLTETWNIQWVTTFSLGLLYTAIGVVALFVPRILQRVAYEGEKYDAQDLRIITALRVLGWALVLIAGFVYFSHIGMVVHTDPGYIS